MTLTPTVQSTLQRYQTDILAALRRSGERAKDAAIRPRSGDLTPFYRQIQYPLGWLDTSFSPIVGSPGKRLLPTLLLLAYEAASPCIPTAETTTHDASHFRR